MQPHRRHRIAGVKDLICCRPICPRLRGRSLPTMFGVLALCIFSVVVVLDRNITTMMPLEILPNPNGNYRMLNWTFTKNETKNLVNHSTAISNLQMISIMPNNPSRHFTNQNLQSGQSATEGSHSTVNPGPDTTEKSHSTVDPGQGDTDKSHSTVHPGQGVTEKSLSTVDPGQGVTEEGHFSADPEQDVTEKGHFSADPGQDVTEKSQSVVDPGQGVTEKSHSTVNPGQGVTEKSHSSADPKQGITEGSHSTVDPGDYRKNLKTPSKSDRTVHNIKGSFSPQQDKDLSTTVQTDTSVLENTTTDNSFITIKLPFTTWPIKQSIVSSIQKILGSTPDNLPLYPDKFKCSEAFKSQHVMTSATIGRTGNELFQLATLLATANETCYTAFLPSSKINLDAIFDIRNIQRQDINTSQFGAISEKSWGFYEGPISSRVNPNRNWTIRGFRQSFRYFHHKRQYIRSSFIFKGDIKEGVASFFSQNFLHNKTKVGIHVRRGDFLQKEKMEHGYTTSSLQYILKAMTYFNETLKNKDLAFIFVSDAIQWCKDNVRLTNAYFSPMKDIGKDLYILTQCDHNIVTSGTFGWMGAWLNETGTVVYDKSYPKEKSKLWYGYSKNHYYPDWWIGL